VETAREHVAALIAAQPDEIVFTGTGTEADNLALRGACRAGGVPGTHVVVSSIEHVAILRCAEALAGEGFSVTKLEVDQGGTVRPESVAEALGQDTAVVSVMHANNETGVVQPIPAMSRLLGDPPVLLHTDAVQSAGKLPLDVRQLGVDLLTLSAHKLYGPQGVGALFVRKGCAVDPILHGGMQEEGIRPGTHNLAGIVGFGVAAKLALRSLVEDAGYMESLRSLLEEGVRRVAPQAVILGEGACRLPNTSNVCFPGLDGMAVAANLDVRGIAVSSGAACSAGTSGFSHVHQAMGIAPHVAGGAIRFSLGTGNSVEDVELTVAALKSVLARAGRRT